jgi:hypothetical protein
MNSAMTAAPAATSLHNSLFKSPQKELSRSDGNETKAQADTNKDIVAPSPEKAKKAKKGVSVREERSKKSMSPSATRVLSADHNRALELRKESEIGERKRTQSAGTLTPPIARRVQPRSAEEAQQSDEDDDDDNAHHGKSTKQDTLPGRIYGEKQLQAFVHYWCVVHPEFVPHSQSLLSYLQVCVYPMFSSMRHHEAHRCIAHLTGGRFGNR